MVESLKKCSLFIEFTTNAGHCPVIAQVGSSCPIIWGRSPGITLALFAHSPSSTSLPLAAFLLPHLSLFFLFLVITFSAAQSPQFPPRHWLHFALSLLAANRQPQKPGTVRVRKRRLPSEKEGTALSATANSPCTQRRLAGSLLPGALSLVSAIPRRVLCT
jgi:hypothetical protein